MSNQKTVLQYCKYTPTQDTYPVSNVGVKMPGFAIDSMNIPGVKVPAPNERVLKIVMSPELGNHKDITLLLSIISPHSKTGLHTHDSDEIMYVATGEGESTMDGKTEKIRLNSVIFAPKSVQHEVKSTSDETLKLVCLYIPPLKPTGYFLDAINAARKERT